MTFKAYARATGVWLALLVIAGCGGVGVPTTKPAATETKSSTSVEKKDNATAPRAASPTGKIVDVPAKKLISSDGVTPGPGDGGTTAYDKFWLDEITRRSGGKITWDKNWGGSLLTFTKVLQGTREGIADVGNIPYNFNPAFLPLTNVVLDVNDVMTDIYGGMQAASELFQTNAAIQKEWADAGLKPLPGPTPWAPKGIICREKISTLDGFKGKRMRTTSEADSTIAAALGSTPVRMDTSEVYEALERGALDCVLTTVATLRTVKWAEPSKWVLTIPEMGIFSCCARAMNLSNWQALPPATQQLILDVGADSWAPSGEVILTTDVEAPLAYAQGLGLEVVRSWPEVGAIVLEANKKNREAWLKRVSEAGNPNGEAVLADWERIARKWNQKIQAEGYPWKKS